MQEKAYISAEVAMNPSKRAFLKLTGTGALILSTGGAAVLIEGCNATTVFQDIEAWVCPAGSSLSVLQIAINGIVSILGPFLPAGAAALISAITASITVACNAVSEYINTVPPPVGVLAKIETALQDIASNLQAFLSAFSVSGNPIIAVVLGLAQVILSTIAAFLAKIGTAVGRKMAIRATVTFGGVSAPVVAKLRTVKQFRADWNSVCDLAGQTAIEL